MQQQVQLIINDISDWQPYYPSQSLLTANEYLQTPAAGKSHILNLCDYLSYLSTGYYVSLLAEARGQRVLPSVNTINDLNNFNHYQLLANPVDKAASKYLAKQTGSTMQLVVCFGQTSVEPLKHLARQLFDRYPCPIININFIKENDRWLIQSLSAGRLADLNDDEQTLFGESLDLFNKRVWRKARAKKEYRYDLAILYNPDEAIPTSDKKALNLFIKAAKECDIEAELITVDDYNRLLEFDALFIRETTKISHYTYHFAKKAEANGMVVIDHPDSIVKCANKVFLKELLDKHHVATPKTELLLLQSDIDYKELGEQL
ncbi:MAG: RimK-like ATPgrasp N-terminal domain-containing protein, partial [Pseudomonadota bacterium]|nr:RimK-like ATPgrasp N-terminal domain-containing protein [Pseudomonadota bacterium]